MQYVLLIGTVIILSIGQLLLKKGVDLLPAAYTIPSLLATLFSPFVLLGFFFYGIASILGIYLLQKFPVSVAIPSMSLAYVVILFASSYLFGERITAVKIFGVVLILVGVVFLSRSQS